MPGRDERMSWTRRAVILVAFAVMLAGVALMVTRQDELWLALSVAGFVLVLAAVPSLRSEGPPAEEPGEPEPVADRDAAGEEVLARRERTGNVTVLPRDGPGAEGHARARGPSGMDDAGTVQADPEAGEAATREHPALTADAPERGRQPATPAEAVAEAMDDERRGRRAAGAPAPSGEPAPVEPPPADEPASEPAPSASPEAGAGEPAPVGRPRSGNAGGEPAPVGRVPGATTRRASRRPAPRGPADGGPRNVAIAGAAAAALVWLWRRARR